MSKFKFLWIMLILLLAACQPTAPAITSSPTAATAAKTPTTAPQATPATTTTPAAATPTPVTTAPTTTGSTPTTGGSIATPATTTTPNTGTVITTTPTATIITGTAKLVDESLIALGKLKSYEATLTMKTEGLSADGNQNLSFDYRVAASDRWAISGTVTTPQTQQLNVIRIGDNVYVRDPTKHTWVQGSAASMSKSFEGLFPDKLLAGLPELLNEFPATAEPKTVGTETINGTETTHYTSTISNYTSSDGSIIEQSTLDLWIAKQDGYPARLTMTLSGMSKDKQKETFDVRLEINNANGNIQIEPPPADQIFPVGGTQITPTVAPATPAAATTTPTAGQ